MRTVIASHPQFTLDNLSGWATIHLSDDETDANPERVRQLLRAAVSMVLPNGLEWDTKTGEIFFDGAPGMGPAVTLNLAGIAYVVIGAVTSGSSWSRPRSVPPDVKEATWDDGRPRVIFGWGPLD
jgi:hypothetical protein